ncbi:exported hypothetical protein [metagenome]|uniref:PASTA domain-containing protein n=1 Tax=metagenome TaxID=256318 RepID=A0A2P2CAS0_9ZZZZ
MRFVVAALLALACLSGCGEATGEDSASSFPAAPEGSRWVGYGQVVVAVPDWWTTGETQCLAPVEDTVYFDSAATVDCQDPPAPSTVREVSALAVLDATRGYAENEVRSMEPIAEASGREVVERSGCEEWFPGVCRHLFAVPSEGVAFAVTIAESGDGDYETIRDSLRILPDGLTTVPLEIYGPSGWTPTWGADPLAVTVLVEAIESAGLRVETTTLERADGGDLAAGLVPGSLLDVEPQLGSVIEVGGTVTLTVAGESFDAGS